MKPTLSCCLIVRDEQALLPEAIRSVAGIADEIIVGNDSRTRDRTMRVALDGGAQIQSFDWHDDFSAARNFVLKKATEDWVLIIDADDRVTGWGRAMIQAVLRQPKPDVEAYGFQIENRRLDGSLMAVDALPSIRLFRNHQGIHYVNRVHEKLVTKDGDDLILGWLKGGIGLVHLGYDPTLYQMRAKDERNLDLILKQLKEHPDDRLMWYELARQHRIGGRHEQAAAAAHSALAMTSYLRPELVQELEQISLGAENADGAARRSYATSDHSRVDTGDIVRLPGDHATD